MENNEHNMGVTAFKLRQPIQAHGEQVMSLDIRRPTIQECRAIKAMPYVLGSDMLPVMEVEVASKYIAVCATIPPGSVNQLDLRDFNQIAWTIIGFFMSSDIPPSAS